MRVSWASRRSDVTRIVTPHCSRCQVVNRTAERRTGLQLLYLPESATSGVVADGLHPTPTVLPDAKVFGIPEFLRGQKGLPSCHASRRVALQAKPLAA